MQQDLENQQQQQGAFVNFEDQPLNQAYPQPQNNYSEGLYKEEQINEDKYDDGQEQTLFSSPSEVRHQFIKKVYGIIAAQLALTAVMIYFTINNYYVAKILMENSFLGYLAFFTAIATQITLFCSREQAKKVPNNYLILLAFTLSFGYIASSQCAFYAWNSNGTPDMQGKHIIWTAACLTSFITIALTVYAFTTKKDYTLYGGMMFIVSISLLLFGILAFVSQLQIMYTLYLWASVTFYGLYLVYDTQLLCEDKQRNLSIDDYIIGAMIIYADIIILFLRILRILAESQKK